MSKGFSRGRHNPYVAVFMMGISIFLVELLVMVFLDFLLPTRIKEMFPEIFWTVIDPVILSILVSPLLYILLLKPMRAQQSELMLSQQSLAELNEGLEQTVLERTRTLLTAQADLERDIATRKKLEGELRANNEMLEQINRQLQNAQGQLMQADKMASVGQLAAGVAHEINNPIGFVYSNLGSLDQYLKEIFALLDVYEKAEASMTDAIRAEVQKIKQQTDIAFLKEDVPTLMKESRDGITRVKRIVQDLKEFSHVDSSDEWKTVDLHNGLDSTLNIVNNEIKYHAEVHKEYGEIPSVECLPSQINQVFMNLLVNAGHAIEGKGVITVRTGQQGEEVFVQVADSGKGIATENLKRIFDPFFTTKAVGKGTGLGLSLSYGIIKKHGGRIDVQSEVGKGTTFTVWLPVAQSDADS